MGGRESTGDDAVWPHPRAALLVHEGEEGAPGPRVGGAGSGLLPWWRPPAWAQGGGGLVGSAVDDDAGVARCRGACGRDR